MMAVARGDLRARLTTPKGVAVLTVFTGGIFLVALFGVAPEGVPDRPALSVIPGIALAGMGFLCAALPARAIVIPEEKDLLDLATAPFSGREVAAGKALATLAYCVVLSLLVVPPLAFLNALRALPWTSTLGQMATMVAVGWAFGGVGSWLSGIENDFLRSLALWALLLGVGFVFLTDLMQPLAAVHPLSPFPSRALWIVACGGAGVLSWGLVARRTEQLRGRR